MLDLSLGDAWLMRKKRTSDKRILFPWEQRGNVVRRLGLRRVRPFAWGVALLIIVTVIAIRERRSAGIRRTRATLGEVSMALNRYLADNGGRCPKRFAQLQAYGTRTPMPVDAWGNPLRLTCPSPRGDLPYLLSSDGPDGHPGGLDRIE